MIMTKKNSVKWKLHEDVANLYFNKQLKPEKIAELTGKSKRTIYRCLNPKKRLEVLDPQKSKLKQVRKKSYSSKIFDQIKELKEVLSGRTAIIIRNLIQKEYPQTTPSISTIRKFIAL